MAVGELAHRAGLAPVPAPVRTGHRPHHHGRVRPLLHHPHGRRHHGAEGGGRRRRPLQRGPVPLADPELVRRDHDHRRRGHLPLPLPCRGRAPRLRARRAPRHAGPPTTSTPTTAHLVRQQARRRLPGVAGHRRRSNSACCAGTARGRDVEAVISNQLQRPSVAGYVANVRDITERKKFEELLSHRALHDPLTGLANRQLILDRADQMLVRARRDGAPGRRLLRRPRQLQGRQRLARPRGRRPPAPGRGQPAGRPAAVERHRGSPGRRRVRDPGRGHLAGRRAEGDRRADPPGAAAAVLHRGLRDDSRSRCRPASASPWATARRAQDLLRRRRHRPVPGQGRRAATSP